MFARIVMAVFRIGIGFNADKVPDPGSQTNADLDSDPGQLEIRVICKLWTISLLLDPDPHSQYGSGSRRAKLMRIHEDPYPDPDRKHWSLFIEFGKGFRLIFVRGGGGNIYSS